MMKLASTLALSTCALIAVTARPAAAQPDPSFSYGKKDDVKDVKDDEWTAKAEAGLVSTTGNSKTTTATLGASATRKEGDNKFQASLVGTYARAVTRAATDGNGDGVISPDEIVETRATAAKNLLGKLRYDRFLTDYNSLYVAAQGGFDEPAGKDFLGGGQIGYSRRLYKDDDHEVVAELGYDLVYERLSTGGSTIIHSARVFSGYKGKLSADTGLEASLEGLFNVNTLDVAGRTAGAFDDTRLNGLLGVTTQVHKNISLSVSFNAKYDHFPAPLPAFALPYAPGFAPLADTLDTLTKASLIVSFL